MTKLTLDAVHVHLCYPDHNLCFSQNRSYSPVLRQEKEHAHNRQQRGHGRPLHGVVSPVRTRRTCPCGSMRASRAPIPCPSKDEVLSFGKGLRFYLSEQPRFLPNSPGAAAAAPDSASSYCLATSKSILQDAVHVCSHPCVLGAKILKFSTDWVQNRGLRSACDWSSWCGLYGAHQGLAVQGWSNFSVASIEPSVGAIASAISLTCEGYLTSEDSH